MNNDLLQDRNLNRHAMTDLDQVVDVFGKLLAEAFDQAPVNHAIALKCGRTNYSKHDGNTQCETNLVRNKNRAAIYARCFCSQESLDRQIAEGKEIAVSKGLIVEPEHVFIDCGKFGAKQYGPRLVELVNLVCDERVQSIIVQDYTTLTRNATLLAQLRSFLEECGTKIFAGNNTASSLVTSPEFTKEVLHNDH